MVSLAKGKSRIDLKALMRFYLSLLDNQWPILLICLVTPIFGMIGTSFTQYIEQTLVLTVGIGLMTSGAIISAVFVIQFFGNLKMSVLYKRLGLLGLTKNQFILINFLFCWILVVISMLLILAYGMTVLAINGFGFETLFNTKLLLFLVSSIAINSVAIMCALFAVNFINSIKSQVTITIIMSWVFMGIGIGVPIAVVSTEGNYWSQHFYDLSITWIIFIPLNVVAIALTLLFFALLNRSFKYAN
ncbi:hypothetical protein [Spiroplasma endosymbiont of Othius punctulatus]|uniref:hypothetical protein n=1 Tax=Spiroplasma endosymbiont of Othius punctulatus TaxID=3066289 RepID=UPI0030CF4024